MDRNYEITHGAKNDKVATREGGVDRNIAPLALKVALPQSPPARVAWIEIRAPTRGRPFCFVATREGGVDRNMRSVMARVPASVATREGGVDRN